MAEALRLATGGTVLVVHHEAHRERRAREALTSVGFDVTVAHTDAQARELASRAAPEVMVVAAELGEGARRLVTELAREPGVPSVVLAGPSASLDVERIRDLGAFGCVVDPFTPEQLWASVEAARGHGRLLRERARCADARRRLRELQDGMTRALQVLRDAGVFKDEPLSLAPARKMMVKFSPREREVFELLLAHKRPKTIAAALGISASTVRNHLKSMFAKVGVSSQEELLERATELR